ncbi:alpha-N-acetylglucosaminidase [Arenibacter algicola]|uniref:alpha-N-acetylglucosaminidase n=1 Tax=Arenibacter algicola TaxID=616991 RepID=UPI001C077420|nr:alpha-N-acetylglucosaminidase [Arenibacter algicola]MBU2903605.1 alpha-N-acetylglucosaminidase [Arenibacter algicola]
MKTNKRSSHMALALLLIVGAILMSCIDRISGTPEAEASSAVNSARDLAGRIVPERADNFIFEGIAMDNGEDVFELESSGDKIVVRGNNGVSMAMGLNWYLKEYCKRSVSLRGNNLNLPEELPKIEGKFRKTSWAKHRYFLNYCAFGYSLPWWDWPQWERLIDFMALNGINAPLSVTGQEATWQAVCKRLGLNDEQIGKFLAGPPYLPFGWMGCLDGWGGPLSQNWIDDHALLQKKILERERAFGMTPIQQGFTGHVPTMLKEKYPDAKMHSVKWSEWNTTLLDPLDPLFEEMSALFMEEQKKLYGTDHMYAADPFIEMLPPSGELDYLDNLGKAIYNGMAKSDPEAVWVFQTWAFWFQNSFWTQPRIKAFLDAVPNEGMICLDLACEEQPMWNLSESFHGKSWLWCNIQNFGDRVFLGGGLDKINSGIMEVRQDPAKGNLVGLGFVNEGLGYNPIIQDLMFEMAWRDEAVDLGSWVDRYAGYRYGQPNFDAEMAWSILKETVYAIPKENHSYPYSILTVSPTLEPPKLNFTYSNTRLSKAWESLLNASDILGELDTYRFDLVNVARQVLSNYASVLQSEMAKAYDEKNIETFGAVSSDFLQLLMDMDELLATREELLLGKNLHDAKRWGNTAEEKAVFEWNAKRVVTLWGTNNLNDYARKEWSGLISGYYQVRWKKFIDEIQKDLQGGKPYNETEFRKELMVWMDNWSNAGDIYPHEPQGESVVIAKKLWAKYGQKKLDTNSYEKN